MALCERCQCEIERPGQKLPPPWFDHDERLILPTGRPPQRVTRQQWEVLRTLWARRKSSDYTSIDGLATVIYGDREDGGPLTCNLIVRNRVFFLRRALLGTPFAIRSDYGRGYRLIEGPPDPPRKRSGRLQARGMAMALADMAPSEIMGRGL